MAFVNPLLNKQNLKRHIIKIDAHQLIKRKLNKNYMVFEQQQEIEVVASLSFSDLQLIEPCPFDQGYDLVALLASEKLLIVYFRQLESK